METKKMAEELAKADTGERNRSLASTFDKLIDSTLALTTSVRRLVNLSWAIVLLNVVLISVLSVAIAWWALTRKPSGALLDAGQERSANPAEQHVPEEVCS